VLNFVNRVLSSDRIQDHNQGCEDASDRESEHEAVQEEDDIALLFSKRHQNDLPPSETRDFSLDDYETRTTNPN
jgi:hypothetical protein